jgi:hypothetical protein
MTSVKIQNAANLATIFAALVAAGSFYYGYQQFKQTQTDTRELLKLEKEALDHERESRAVDLLVKYNEVVAETPDNLGVSLAESVFRVRKDDAGWKETVVWMLGHHVNYLKKYGLQCPTFDSEFIELANRVTKVDVCKVSR